MDNLNYIQICFRVFIYKIIVLRQPELSKKEIKNYRRMKTRLGTRTSQKNPRRRVQTAPEHKRVFGVQRAIRHFWSAERHSKRAEFSPCRLQPNGLQVTIRHTLFDHFAKGCVWIQTLIVYTYFLEPSDLYKQRLNFIIQHLFFFTLQDAYVLGS